MPVTNNNVPILNLPSWEMLQSMPGASAAGICMCNDRRGTNRFIYLMISRTSFWRYDVQANTYQQLASAPGGTLGAGTVMVFDPSRGANGYVWALISDGAAAPTWQYYDVAANAWTSRAVTNLPATFGTDAALCHPCTTYNAAGDDDSIYLIGNNATAWYKYSITGNSWTVMATPVTAAPGAGCAIHWLPVYNPDKLIILRGGATATVYEYTISVPGFVTKTYLPASETFTTGTMSCARTGTTKLLIQLSVSMRIYELDLALGLLTPLCTQYLVPTSTSHVGDRMIYIKEPNGIEFLYLGLHTSSYFLRTGLIF